VLKANQFGGTLADRYENKLFFFSTMKVSAAQSQQETSPRHRLQRAGDFRNLCTERKPVTVYDPNTTRLADPNKPGVYVRDAL